MADRVREGGGTARVPSLSESVSRGIIGCTIMSMAGFAPWAFAGRWFHQRIGEAGLYAVCAIVFIVLSGPLLHRLIIGPGSLGRFYKLFGVAFAAYAIAWTVGWMSLGGRTGSIAGLLAGTVLMGGILAAAFAAWRSTWRAAAALFAFNAFGYFAGEWLYLALAATATNPTLVKLVWGVCYGVGLGIGVGLAFYHCQRDAREKLTEDKSGV